ncbi:MAG: beta-lactamase family protein [Asticcacaulis sp.]|nr:beta-lactamase family protein [Asticcacaulis sp.]
MGKVVGARRGVALAAAAALILPAGQAEPQDTAATTPPVAASAPELKPYVPSTPASSSASAVATSSAASSQAAKPKPKPKPATATPTAATSSSAPGYMQTVPSKSAATVPAPVVIAPVPQASAIPPTVTAAGHPVSTPISADDIETFTDSVVRTLMQRDHVLGATVAVVQGNTPLLVKGYGYDRLSPARRVDPNNSMFRIGSVTKTFTWIVARQEIEAGRIGLDSPIGDYVPADIFTEDGRYKPITLRVLMDHTGGFDDTSLGHLFQLNGARINGPDSYFRRHKPRRVREPGQFSTYSNYGAALAATALSQTAKAKDVPSLMEARIFQPLGMDHTTLREPYPANNLNLENLPAPMAANLTGDLSDGFIWDGATYKAQPFDHAIPMSGALGGTSTAKDMARLMSVMLANGQADGIQLYNGTSAAAFRTPMLKAPEGYNGWASGLMIRTAPSGYVTYGHGGSTLWFNSNLVVVPEMNLGIFIATNTQTGTALADSFPNLLLDHLEGDLVRAPLMPTPNQAYAEHKAYYDAIRGKYVSTRRAYGGLEGAVTRLINTVEVGVDGDGRLILDTQDGTSAFVPASAQGFFNPQDSEDPGPAGSLGGLHFLTSGDGHVLAFETAANTARYERVDWFHDPTTLNVLTVMMAVTCVLVLLSLLLSFGRDRPTEEQARANLISGGLSVLWLVAIFVFNRWQAQISEDPGSLFTQWPAGAVVFASWLSLIATLGTLFQIGSAYFVFSEGQRFSVADGWPQWQKVAHGLLLAYWLLYIVELALWGALIPL